MDKEYMEIPSGSISVPQIRQLKEIANTMDMALNESEFRAIVTIYNSALERILKANDQLEKVGK